MNRKQKKELRERRSTRQLMGISQLTRHGVKTPGGELVFYLIQPDNLSVLSSEGVQSRVRALTDLLRGAESVRLLALDSRESFQRNKDWYRQRLEQEHVPALRELLRQDMEHLDLIQRTTASARAFALVFTLEKDSEEQPGYLGRLEKRIRDCGFRVRLAEEADIKRLLAVYYQHGMDPEQCEDIDGERWVEGNA